MADEERPLSEPPADDDLDALGGALAGEAGESAGGADDVDLASLSAMAGDTADEGADSEPPEDDATLDLRGLTAQSALRSPVSRESAPPDEPQATDAAAPAAAADPPAPAPAAAVQSAAEPARQAPRAAGRTWVLPLAVGLLVGGLASALVFVRGEPAVPPQADPATAGSAEAVRPTPVAATPVAATAVASDVAPAAEPGTSAPDTPEPSAAAEPAQSAAVRRAAPRPGQAASARAAAEDDSDDSVAARGAEALGATPGGDAKPGDDADDDKSAEDAAENAKVERTMDDLLDQALSPTAQLEAKRAREQAMFQESGLPATPSREDVTQAMTVLLPAIRGCAMGQSGLATAGIVVRNDGRVASVSVSGAPFAGTASGRCMEGVMRRARFPRFKQPTFRVKFPLAIQ